MRCCQVMFEVELAQEIQLFFVAAQVFVLFLRCFPGVASVREVPCFKRKERSCSGLATATLSSIELRSCLAVLKITRQRDITTGTSMGR